MADALALLTLLIGLELVLDVDNILVISQIVLLDIVFSIDSVITAIGMTKQIWIIITAVMVSFLAILAFAVKLFLQPFLEERVNLQVQKLTIQFLHLLSLQPLKVN